MLLPVLLFGLGTPNLPAGVSTVLAASELPAGLIVSVVMLGDEIGVMQWVGVIAILFGVIVSQLRFGGIAARMDVFSVQWFIQKRLQSSCINFIHWYALGANGRIQGQVFDALGTGCS